MGQPIVDGSVDFSAGQNFSINPDKIDPNAYYIGVNVTGERGSINPRWGFKEVSLSFESGGITRSNLVLRTWNAIFRSGRFQGAIKYQIGSERYFVAVISGIIFLINRRTNEVTILNVTDGSTISDTIPRVVMTVADKYVVIHDWPNSPVIVEGLEARRADPEEDEVPVSTLSAYNQNRLFVANAGNEFTAGDPTGSLFAPNAPITFQEVNTSGSEFFGQIFQLPTEFSNAPITGMQFLPITDTSTGVGPLLVSTANNIFSYQTQAPRAGWTAGQFGSMFVANSGFAGPLASTAVGSDIFYMSGDGQIRTVSMSRSEQSQWAQVPISNEVENWTKFWDKSLVAYASVAYFDNKVFFTVNPFRARAATVQGKAVSDYAHGGLVVLSLKNLSAFGQASAPAWDGLWTGVFPTQIIADDKELIVFAKNNQRINTLYRVTPEDSTDEVGGARRLVRSVLVTKEYVFESPYNNKKIRNIDLSLEQVAGEFEIEVEWKPSQAPVFLKWRKFCHEAPWSTKKIPSLAEVNGFASHTFRELNLGTPNEHECSPITEDYYSTFRRMQLRFTITGKSWELRAVKISGTAEGENETESVCTTDSECPFPVVKLLQDAFNYWETEGFSLCQ